jgi:hypothetical protein
MYWLRFLSFTTLMFVVGLPRSVRRTVWSIYVTCASCVRVVHVIACALVSSYVFIVNCRSGNILFIFMLLLYRRTRLWHVVLCVSLLLLCNTQCYTWFLLLTPYFVHAYECVYARALVVCASARLSYARWLVLHLPNALYLCTHTTHILLRASYSRRQICVFFELATSVVASCTASFSLSYGLNFCKIVLVSLYVF